MSKARKYLMVIGLSTRPLIIAVVTALLALGVATPAWGNFEQVGTFGENSFSSPLYNTVGIAVNDAGSGGVPAGTLYMVRRSAPGVSIYNAEGQFLSHFGSQSSVLGVAVDQATGNVYVQNYVLNPGADVVSVYSPDGSRLLASFAPQAEPNQTVNESPESRHEGLNSENIAVDNAGDVYLPDSAGERGGDPEDRVMVFEPAEPGDYEHYVYAGRSRDIAYSTSSDPINYRANQLAADSAGNLFFIGQVSSEIYEFAHGEPNSPSCEYTVPGGGAEGITVNSQTDEVYYYTFKDRSHLHQLTCDTATHKFVDTGAFLLSPRVAESENLIFAELLALAFDPLAEYQGVHPPGVIYAVGVLGLAYILAPPESHPPTVEAPTTVSVNRTEAVVTAAINPNGFPTQSAVQYIGDSQFEENGPGDRFAGATTAPLGGATVGSGTSPIPIRIALRGLLPDAEYHYRFVASSHCNPADEGESCEVAGIEMTLHTFRAEPEGLPDGRAYELVSPIGKNGGEAFPIYPDRGSCGPECKPESGISFPVQAGPDGEAVAYMGTPFSSTGGAAAPNEYVSRRTPGGWQTKTLSPALQAPTGGGRYVGLDEALTEAVLLQGGQATLSAEAPAGFANLYAEPATGEAGFTPLIRNAPPNQAPATFETIFAGASLDYTKKFFEANDALTEATASAPAAVDGGRSSRNLYEETGGGLSLVNVLPGNETTSPGADFGAPPAAVESDISAALDLSHVISDDGSRVFWSDKAGQVYVREDDERTREVPDHTGRFLTASADGDVVLLSDGDLYDLETEESTDLTEGHGGFQGIAGQSEDLSKIYFVDTAALTPPGEDNENGEHAEAGGDNLYAWTEGAPTFVATLLAGDDVESTKVAVRYGAWRQIPARRSAEASGNGRWLAFQSAARLTRYNDVGQCSAGNEESKGASSACDEVYLYDSQTNSLVCASCDRSGVAPLGPSLVPVLQQAPPAFSQPRYLLDDGRLYFDTADSLVPADANEGVEDVYEFEQAGTGTCADDEGCVSLISAGQAADDSNFLAADLTGKNVFFTTRDRLVAADRDGLDDLYDAREAGGIPSQNEPAPAPGCGGEACQAPVAPVATSSPGSLSFEGVGNLISPPTVVKPKPTSPSLTRGQKLARTLRACKRERKGKKRTSCERLARKRYGSHAARANSKRKKGAR
jgi:hypothetical protein